MSAQGNPSPAFTRLEARRHGAPLFIFGDHSSNHIPDELNALGLTGQDLTRHIAWDIGTQGVITALCTRFGCAGHLAGVSRLVIDCNREEGAIGLIPKSSDGSLIPGNQNLSPAGIARRLDEYYRPYHAELSRRVGQASRQFPDPLFISVHSFTPKPLTGEARGAQIALLVKADETRASAALKTLRKGPPHYDVRVNDPYSAWELNHTVDTHLGAAGLRHLNFELRQDLIETPAQQIAMADYLAQTIAPLL